jgi:hypothetical protein
MCGISPFREIFAKIMQRLFPKSSTPVNLNTCKEQPPLLFSIFAATLLIFAWFFNHIDFPKIIYESDIKQEK